MRLRGSLKLLDGQDDTVNVGLEGVLVVDSFDDLILCERVKDHSDDAACSLLIDLHHAGIELLAQELLLGRFITLGLDGFSCEPLLSTNRILWRCMWHGLPWLLLVRERLLRHAHRLRLTLRYWHRHSHLRARDRHAWQGLLRWHRRLLLSSTQRWECALADNWRGLLLLRWRLLTIVVLVRGSLNK